MNIAFWSGKFGLWGDLSPTEFREGKKMFGGGETALLYTAMGLAGKGHQVSVYGNVKQCEEAGVQWVKCTDPEIPAQEYFDVLISCDDMDIFTYRPRARMRIADFACNSFLIGDLDKVVDFYCVRSDWHARQIRRADSRASAEKFMILPYGIDPEICKPNGGKVPHSMVYASSPDRGLVHLLRFFPQIRERIPDAELHVYYNIKVAFEGWKWCMEQLADDLWQVYDGLVTNPKPGVTYHGPLHVRDLIKDMQKWALLCYPCDTMVPTEGFSITAAQGFATKTAVMLADCDCMSEVWGDYSALLPLPIEDKRWVDSACEILQSQELLAKFSERGYEAVMQKYTWPVIVDQWDKFLKGDTKSVSFLDREVV